MVRAPAWGISGPWRDRTGYAQTMEMGAGLAWMTGWPDAAPEIPNGPMDPIAGNHGFIGLMMALEHRRRTGEGGLVEVPMIGGALNLGCPAGHRVLGLRQAAGPDRQSLLACGAARGLSHALIRCRTASPIAG